MGVGYFNSEELVYNPNTGALLTDRTWVSNLFNFWLVSSYTNLLFFFLLILFNYLNLLFEYYSNLIK